MGPSLELKVYNLNGVTTKANLESIASTVTHAMEVTRTGQILEETDDGWVNTAWFRVVVASPDKTGAWFIDHEVKIRFTLEHYRAGHATIRDMEFMPRALIINGHVCRWSPSMGQDRTTQMVFYLTHVSGTPMILLDDEAMAEVIRHLLEQNVVMESVWGKLANATVANARPSLYGRILNPELLPHLLKPDDSGIWEKPQCSWKFTIETYPNFITPLSPMTLAMKGIADTELEVSREEMDSKLLAWNPTSDEPGHIIAFEPFKAD
jgi:hypothetical protein